MANRYLEAAEQARRWVVEHPSSAEPNLYAGAPGEVLFDFVAGGGTGDEKKVATLHRLIEDPNCDAGLFTGLAGIGFVLDEICADAEPVIDLLRVRAEVDGAGVHWGGLTDLISGAAGTALFLAERGGQDGLELAVAACRWLVTQAQPAEPVGFHWRMGRGLDSYPVMPNFSHGTAGIAYALATVGDLADESSFVEIAIDGARQLLAIARTGNDTCAVRQHLGIDFEAYPLGWCHGPTGLAALFRRLELVTGDAEWATWVRRSARTVRTSGIPQRLEPGFWDNVARCCGSTGVAELFLDLHQSYGDDDALAFSVEMTDDLLERATVDAEGMRWSNVEFRADPPMLPPESGLMQGASGIGLWLVRLGTFLDGREVRVSWPWSPFV